MWIWSDKKEREEYQSQTYIFSSLLAEKQKLLLCSLKVWAMIACSEHPHNQAAIKAEKEAPEIQKPFISSPSSNLTLRDLFDYVDCLQQQQKLHSPENPTLFFSVTGELFSQASLSQD